MSAQVIELAVRPPQAGRTSPRPRPTAAQGGPQAGTQASRRAGRPGGRRAGRLAAGALLLALGIGAAGLLGDPVELGRAIVLRYGALWVALGGVVLLGLALVRRPRPRRRRPLTLVRTEGRR